MINLILKITIFILFLYINILYAKVSFANIVVISYESYNNENLNIEAINDHISILAKEKYFIFSTNIIAGLLTDSKILPDYSVAVIISSNKKQIINSPIVKKILVFVLLLMRL